MHISTQLLLAALIATSVGCSKPDPVVGTWNGKEELTAGQRKAIGHQPPKIQEMVSKIMADAKGTLTLKADVDATMNATNGKTFEGKWTHKGNAVRVSLAGLEDQTMTLSADGKTLTYRGWTYTKQ